MTKDTLIELLSKVKDNARICIILNDGTVTDIDDGHYAKAQ